MNKNSDPMQGFLEQLLRDWENGGPKTAPAPATAKTAAATVVGIVVPTPGIASVVRSLPELSEAVLLSAEERSKTVQPAAPEPATPAFGWTPDAPSAPVDELAAALDRLEPVLQDKALADLPKPAFQWKPAPPIAPVAPAESALNRDSAVRAEAQAAPPKPVFQWKPTASAASAEAEVLVDVQETTSKPAFLWRPPAPPVPVEVPVQTAISQVAPGTIDLPASDSAATAPAKPVFQWRQAAPPSPPPPAAPAPDEQTASIPAAPAPESVRPAFQWNVPDSIQTQALNETPAIPASEPPKPALQWKPASPATPPALVDFAAALSALKASRSTVPEPARAVAEPPQPANFAAEPSLQADSGWAEASPPIGIDDLDAAPNDQGQIDDPNEALDDALLESLLLMQTGELNGDSSIGQDVPANVEPEWNVVPEYDAVLKEEGVPDEEVALEAEAGLKAEGALEDQASPEFEGELTPAVYAHSEAETEVEPQAELEEWEPEPVSPAVSTSALEASASATILSRELPTGEPAPEYEFEREEAVPPPISKQDGQEMASVISDLEKILPAGQWDQSEAETRRVEVHRHLVFAINEEKFAVKLDYLLEIDNMPNWTGIPGLPPAVRGLINLRGEILSLLELRAILGLAYPELPKKGKIFVATGAERQSVSAFAVDEIEGIVGFDPARMTPVATLTAGAGSAKGVTATIEEGDSLIRILDIAGILAEVEKTFSLDQAWM